MIDNVPLVRKQCSKFVGVFIDENLNWNEQIRHMSTCISRNIGILYKTKNYLPKQALFLLYNSLILPYITYCNLVWASSAKTKINSIHLLQKKNYQNLHWGSIPSSYKLIIQQFKNIESV